MRLENWSAIRNTKELFINDSAWSGVVVTVRQGVTVEGSGQSKAVSSGSQPARAQVR